MYSSEPTTATSPVRSSSASAVKTIASKCLRTNCPVRVLSRTALRQFWVAKERSTSWPSSLKAVMYSPRAAWCRWACARASSTRLSSLVAVNFSLSMSARSNITARSRPVCPYSSTSQKLPWWAETFSICSYCFANPPKLSTARVTAPNPPACTTWAFTKVRTAGEPLPSSRVAISSTDASSSRPSRALRTSAVMAAAFVSASWAGPPSLTRLSTVR